MDLKNRVSLVTGSTSGLGLFMARRLFELGSKVILCGRNIDKITDTNDLASFECFSVDGENNDSVSSFFKSNISNLDILINNIGGAYKFGKFEDLTDNDWLKTFNLNVMTAVRFTREALPFLKKSGHGRIISIASLPALQPGKFNPDYSACKAALVNLSKYWANEYAQYSILSNVICPNTIAGGGWRKNIKDRSERDGISVEEAENIMIKEASAKNPLGRVGKPIDIANLVAFLASDEAQYITGQCICIDGGEQRSII